MRTVAASLVVCIAVLLPEVAGAQSGDAQYCAAMIQLYRTYVGAGRSSGDVPIGIAACNNGDTATGIPILEKALKDAQISLPPRN